MSKPEGAEPDLPFPVRRRISSERIHGDQASRNCDRYRRGIDDYLRLLCSRKVNELSPSPGSADCPCDRDPAKSGVDLVVLVDSSGSMGGTWEALGEAAAAGIEAAATTCEARPRVVWLFVDRSDTGVETGSLVPPFNQSHEQYLVAAGATGPFAADGDGKLDDEQGAKAIVDLANHFDWREGACRAIFYVSDELLDSLSKTLVDSRRAADAAIAAANKAGITVFTHLVEADGSIAPGSANYPELSQHYKDLAEKTGGKARIGGKPSAEVYTELLRDAICNSCGEERCVEAKLPDLKPCIHLSWGDSECDCIESDDIETLCIRVCNCYSNITFANLKISAVLVMDENGERVPTLPDGTPSVEVKPFGPLCFGNIGPCVDGVETCVSREVVLMNRGARPGVYEVRLYGVCFDLVEHYFLPAAGFRFEICRDR